MGYGVFLPGRWKRQPQGAVEVDHGHPAMAGVHSVYLGHLHRFAFARGSTRYVQPAGNRHAGRYGIGARVGSAEGAAYAFVGATGATTPLTFALAVQWIAQPGYPYFAGIVDPDNPGNRLPTMTGAGVVGNEPAILYNDGSTKVLSSQLTAVAGSTFLLVAVFDPSAQTLRLVSLKDGATRSDVSVSVTASAFVQGVSTSSFGIGKASNFNPGDLSSIPIAAYVRRAWGNSEIEGFFDNPWQLFRAPRPIIYSFPSATIPTLSSATVVNVSTTGATPQVYVDFP